MIKRIIEISAEAMHLAVRNDQLLLLRATADEPAPQSSSPKPQDPLASSIPCEDIGMVLVDHPQTTFTLSALTKLMEFGAAVVVCGREHLPAGLLLPMVSHTEVVWRLDEQVSASRPVVKNLWKQIVVAKIKAQADRVSGQAEAYTRLRKLAGEVKSGDTENHEGQAAKVYWGAWSESIWGAVPRHRFESGGMPPQSKWRRDPDGADAVNGLLNYGYAVVRAAVARALVSAGLQPAIGLHHCNRSNAFCLADDLVEPLRPMVDDVVRELVRRGRESAGVSRENKAALLGVMFGTVEVGGQRGPLMVGLHRYAASLARCYGGEGEGLLVPVVVAGGE